MSKISLQAPSPDKCEWLQTWQAKQGELMEAGYTIQVILADDVAKIHNSTEKPYLEAQKWAVSVPIQNTTKSWDKKTFKFYRVAPTTDVHYHPEIGAYDPKLNKSLQAHYGHKS
jgi:lipopolysaccharide assembly outer membrane protein LptD (OstA)